MPKALKTCPKSNKSPNLVTLEPSSVRCLSVRADAKFEVSISSWFLLVPSLPSPIKFCIVFAFIGNWKTGPFFTISLSLSVGISLPSCSRFVRLYCFVSCVHYLWFYDLLSVTRFGEIWLNLNSLWAIFWIAYLVFGIVLYHLWHFYATGQIVKVVNGQIFE